MAAAKGAMAPESRGFLARAAMLAATLLASGILLAASAAPNISATQSSITATFRQSGVPVDAGFRSFSGRIVYNPAKAAAATATLEVLTGSLDIGAEESNAEVRKKPWFDSATYPKATFTSQAIKPMGPGRFDATGLLAMKGKVQTITVPISVKAAPDGSVFEGAFTLSRKAWGIGEPVWDDVLEDAVVVRFHLVVTGK
jgi:polyisoprenoid-binding protein YceI